MNAQPQPQPAPMKYAYYLPLICQATGQKIVLNGGCYTENAGVITLRNGKTYTRWKNFPK